MNNYQLSFCGRLFSPSALSHMCIKAQNKMSGGNTLIKAATLMIAFFVFFPSNMKALSENLSFTVTEGSRTTIYANRLGTGQYDVGDKKWTYSDSYDNGTGNIVVLSKDTWSASILGLRPGTALMTLNEVYYDGGQKTAYHYITITVLASNYSKIQLTPCVERTKVLKGTTLTLSPSVSGATIYYSTSGNVIPGKSTTFPSSGITLNSNTTIKAQAVKDKYPLSDVLERTYEIVEYDFKATVAGGNVIYFKIINEEDKTCQVVYVPEESTGILRIPKLINGYTVTKIGEQAIATCKDITSVVIPATITSIGKNAFQSCTGLSIVDLPEGLTEIGEGAFYACTGLTTVSIPASVIRFYKSAFEGCTSLSVINMAAGLSLIGERAFAGCTSITSSALPDGLIYLGSSSFKNCTGLTSVTLPGTIKNIGSAAFSGCSGLKTVNLCDGLKDVGTQTFADCISLTSVSLPSTLEKIGNTAFKDCKGLITIDIPNGVTQIDESAFSGCSNLNDVVLPKDLSGIGNSAFNGCSSLTMITIPENVTSIGKESFAACPALKTIHSEIMEPFIISDDVFTCYDESVTLYVPNGTSDLYWSTSGWIQFINIVDYSPENDGDTIILDENSPSMPEASDGVVDVVLNRSIKGREWNTIVLPFDATAEQVKATFGDEVELATFTAWKSEKDAHGAIVSIDVSFNSTLSIAANTPMLIKTSCDMTSINFEGVAIEPEVEPTVQVGHKASERGYFYGTYIPKNVPEENLFLNGNKFWYSTGKTVIKGYRGYFEFRDVLDAYYEAAEAKINLWVDGEATSIGLTPASSPVGVGSDTWYDLSGRRIDNSQFIIHNSKLKRTSPGAQMKKGVYLSGGRKVAVQ